MAKTPSLIDWLMTSKMHWAGCGVISLLRHLISPPFLRVALLPEPRPLKEPVPTNPGYIDSVKFRMGLRPGYTSPPTINILVNT